MGHIIELVLGWAVLALVIAFVSAAAGFVIRAVGNREWSNLVIAEGAFAIGAVMGFVVLVFVEVAL